MIYMYNISNADIYFCMYSESGYKLIDPDDLQHLVLYFLVDDKLPSHVHEVCLEATATLSNETYIF